MTLTRDTSNSCSAAAPRVILLLALIVRVGWGAMQPASDAALRALPDQAEYLQLGRNLLHGNGLVMTDPHFGDQVYAYRMPGYPLLIAACGGQPRIVRVVQALLDTATVLAVYLLARRWLGRRGATLAMALVAFNPFMIYFSGLILSETLFTTMLAWALVMLSKTGAKGDGRGARGEETGARGEGRRVREKARAQGRAEGSVVVGSSPLVPVASPRSSPLAPVSSPAAFLPLLGTLLLAVCVLVRPSAASLTVLSAMVAAGLNRQRGGAYPRWWPLPPATTGLLLVIAVLLPWAARNHRVLDTWIWTATDRGATLYDGFNDNATGGSDQSRLAIVPGVRMGNEVQRNAYLADLAWTWANEHPGEDVRLAVMKVLRTWSPWPLNSQNGSTAMRLLACLYSVPFFALILLGLCRGKAHNGDDALPLSAKVLLMLPALYFTVVHAMSVGSLRYRIPCEAPMAVVAASGLMGLLSARTAANDDSGEDATAVSSET